MRYVNIFKCWPFPIGNLTREQIESRLPPMEVPIIRSHHDHEEEEAESQPKVEDDSPSEDNLPQPPPQLRPLLPVKREFPAVEDEDGENSGISSNYQMFEGHLNALKSNVELAKSEKVKLISVKQEEEFDMVCPICSVFKTIAKTPMDTHMRDCLEKKSREENRQGNPRSNHNLKMRRRRKLTEIFKLPTKIDVADDKNVSIEKITTLPKNEF